MAWGDLPHNRLAAAQASRRELAVTVTPAAWGPQLVRMSLPFPHGMLREGQMLAAHRERRRPAGAAVMANAAPPRHCRAKLILLLVWCIASPGSLLAQQTSEQTKVIVTATNPDPQNLPTLGVWQRDEMTFVSASFPDVPEFTCDSWCYESALDFIGARALDGGKVELRHRAREQPQMLLVTTVTPEPGAVEFAARAELDQGAAGPLPANPLVPNLCWQLRRAPAFASSPEPYPEFIKRCFIFTDKGRTFLDHTARRPIPCRPPDDPYNNPPWVQMYLRAGQPQPPVQPTSWADYSPDRYTVPIIGAVSRDGEYLAAIANDSANMMAQAWHDCMHNNPEWLPAAAPADPAHDVAQPPSAVNLVWRLKIYAMENDAAALLARAARDFAQTAANGRSRRVRAPASRAAPPTTPAQGPTFQSPGVKDYLPVFSDRLAARLTFPLSWLSGKYKDFKAWRKAARAKVMECLLTPPPPAAFNPEVIAKQDRGTYVARKVVFNLTGDSRVLGLMLVPKGEGPFPAVLLLHDHGARFDIGKEKVIEPFDVPPQRLASAHQWADECYGGRFIGDELAKRGYVCFATDALNWSDRGGAGYEGQQALASNLMHFGMSLAGLIAHEDLRAAEFLATRPEVDARRVAAVGLSMGAFRTWQVAALSDRISAGAAICWMATTKGLMVPGNNQTGGQSAFTMTHPGLFAYLDYPDAASIACPKPMLFYNGTQDALFPVPSVREAYAKLRRVWESQHAGERLVTKLWQAPHVFNRQMQDEVFAWLEGYLHPRASAQGPARRAPN
jgi:dienelactone hydrolase